MINIVKKTLFKLRLSIEPLYKYPHFYSILAHWAYEKWHINSTANFRLINLDYRRRADFKELPISFVAMYDDYPVGMVSLKEKDLLSRPDLKPWLSALYVMDGFRKKGIARKLVDYLKKEAVKRNHKRIYLFVDNANREYLYNFYLKLGWKPFDRAKGSNSESVIIMYIDL